MKKLQENPVETEPSETERTMIVNGICIRVKSVFGDAPLEKAMCNLALRKLAEKKTA